MDASLIMYTCSLVFGFIFLIAFLIKRVNKTDVKSLMLKSATSVMFILSGIFLTVGKPSLYSGLITAGLTCGILGDIWLDMKFMYRQDEKFLTNAGFISFSFGHFFYIAAVISGAKDVFKPIALLPSLAVAVVVGLVVYFGEKPMKLEYGSYKAISTFYGSLLFFVTALSLFTALFSGIKNNIHLIAFFIGGLLFAVSDLILSGTYFGKGKDRSVDIITNHVTYYLAQFIIASSILFI